MTAWSLPGVTAPAAGDPRHPGPLGFLRKHFRGDYSLPRAYWLHLHIGSKIFETCSVALLETVADHAATRHTSALAVLLIILWYPLWLFLAGGAWAAAGKHEGRGGSRGWAGTARVMIVIGLLVQLFSVPGSVRNVRDYWTQTDGKQPGPAPAFYLSGDARSLTLHGGINDGTADQLEAMLARAPKVTTLVLASGGGWTHEGQRIGKLVTARGLNTHVETECSSACTLAFLAGKVRSARTGAQLGFHRFGPGDRESNEIAVREAYGKLGMTRDFIRRISETAPENMWYPNAEALLLHHVLTQEPGQAGPAMTGPGARMKAASL